MKKIKTWWMSFILLCGLTTVSCDNEDNPTFPEQPETSDPTGGYDMTGFARGADVSWLTEMEASGRKFYDNTGKERECMELLRELGMNAVRLRVWVNPTDGWCNKQDVLVKAWRASKLGYRLMIDFHYSDSWADPGQQTKPAAWAAYTFNELKQAVADHTTDVLSALKAQNIGVEWVQVGNETRTGMLWDDGKASAGNTSNFAQLINAGYDAVKGVYPEAKVIIHIDEGNNPNRYNWLFDGLQADGARWDVIGMSLYPEPDGDNESKKDWRKMNDDCIANMKALVQKYGTEVMMCEIGINWNYEEAEAFYTDFITKAKAVEGCLGVFAWEPQCYGGWEGYHKGMFNDDGRPTDSMNAFKRD